MYISGITSLDSKPQNSSMILVTLVFYEREEQKRATLFKNAKAA